MNFNGCENIVFEHNRIVGADLMSTGGRVTRCFTRGVSRNIYTAHNSYENMNGWDREAFTSDAGGGAYFGPVVSVEGDWILLADDPEVAAPALDQHSRRRHCRARARPVPGS